MKKPMACLLIILALCLSVSQAAPVTQAKSLVMIDAETGQLMWAKNPDEKLYPASTTKLMTAILYYEANQDNLGREFTVGQVVNQTPPGSSIMGLKVGDRAMPRDLLFGLMLPSGNDAALVAAADHSGTVEAFVEKMNEKAKEYGMTDTHFTNPHGFHDPNHYTTARDFAILAYRYNQIPELRKIAATKTYSYASQKDATMELLLVNTNHLLGPTPADQQYYYEYATGMKTGYHDQAGYCLVSSGEYQGQAVIAAAFGYANTQTRFTEAKTILEYGLKGFTTVSAREFFPGGAYQMESDKLKIVEYNYGVLPAEVQVKEEDIKLDKDVAQAVAQGKNLTKTFAPANGLTYPVKAGQQVGQLNYGVGKDVVYTAPVVAARDFARQQMPGMYTGVRHAIKRSYDKKAFIEEVIYLGLDFTRQAG